MGGYGGVVYTGGISQMVATPANVRKDEASIDLPATTAKGAVTVRSCRLLSQSSTHSGAWGQTASVMCWEEGKTGRGSTVWQECSEKQWSWFVRPVHD